MRNSPRQFWIHHSPFKVVFFCDKEAKSNIVSKYSQFFSTGLCSRSVSPTLFCSPHWNTNLTLSLATAWKLPFFKLDGSSENRSIFLPKDLHPLVCDPSSLPKSCVVGVSDLIFVFFSFGFKIWRLHTEKSAKNVHDFWLWLVRKKWVWICVCVSEWELFK